MNSTLKLCKECKAEKTVDAFYTYTKVSKLGKSYGCTSTLCKKCHVKKTSERREQIKDTVEFKERRRQVERKRSLKRLHGLTIEQYDSMLEVQGGRCGICGTEDPGNHSHSRFSVDHDHTTGVNRGLLCHACNCVLGYARDDTQTLASAIEYLQKERNETLQPAGPLSASLRPSKGASI